MSWQSCQLNSENCLSLYDIVQCFGAPVSEAWAFAIVYEACRTLSEVRRVVDRNDWVSLEDMKQLFVSKDGVVHQRSFVRNKNDRDRTEMVSEKKAISDLSVVIYSALDFGLNSDEERKLSPELEDLLLKQMMSDDDSLDEGIGQDNDEYETGWTRKIMEECAHKLSVTSEAETHFRAVCRAMVSEVLELATFIEKVSTYDEKDDQLKELDMQDWARLWVQCMKDLRHGVKLKKTNYSKTPVEYELTPYEVLMDDIRSRRYKLNKVMVDGEIPKIKKDAHDIILEFIRSRPPLRSASRRELKPLVPNETPGEKLMASIRNSSARSSLRKTSGPPKRYSHSPYLESSRTIERSSTPEGPSLIMIPPEDMASMMNFSDTEDDMDSASGASSRQLSRQTSRQMSRDQSHDDDQGQARTAVTPKEMARVARDLALHGSSPLTSPTCLSRRHSLSVCETPKRRGAVQRKISVKVDSNSSSNSTSRSTTPTTTSSGSVTPTFGARPDSYCLNTPQMHANLQSELLQSDQWTSALQTLALNLDEVVHIRSVLTKAELESLPLDGTLKEDVEKGRVCFLCMKTRFGFFTWGVRCQLCHQQVCNKCSQKMRIPLEHFASIPVEALSGRVTDQPATQMRTSQSLRTFRNSVGSAPPSPEAKRKSVSHMGDSNGPISLPANMVKDNQGVKKRESKKSKEEKLQGPNLHVCTDCRQMVLEVIRAQSTAKRIQMTQSLFGSNNYPKEEVF